MRVIEKITEDGDIQGFEFIQSRKELATFLRDMLWESVYAPYARDKGNIHTDPDTSYFWYDVDGKFYSIHEGDKVARPNVARIKKFMQINSASVVIYGDVPIVKNEHYGDWDAQFD